MVYALIVLFSIRRIRKIKCNSHLYLPCNYPVMLPAMVSVFLYHIFFFYWKKEVFTANWFHDSLPKRLAYSTSCIRNAFHSKFSHQNSNHRNRLFCQPLYGEKWFKLKKSKLPPNQGSLAVQKINKMYFSYYPRGCPVFSVSPGMTFYISVCFPTLGLQYDFYNQNLLLFFRDLRLWREDN